jgi:hypothetical protein
MLPKARLLRKQFGGEEILPILILYWESVILSVSFYTEKIFLNKESKVEGPIKHIRASITIIIFKARGRKTIFLFPSQSS